MLTKKAIEAVRPVEGRRVVVYDDNAALPGFGVRVTPNGVKSFVLWIRTETGRKRMLTLGRFGPMTLHQAREKAAAKLRVVAGGEDPAEIRREGRQAATVRELAEEYLERHSKRQKRSWRADQRRLETYVLPRLGGMKARDVRRSDVARLIGDVAERRFQPSRLRKGRGAQSRGGGPVEANRVLALISVMFSRAEEWGTVPEGHPNPARGVARFREQSRARFLATDELPRLYEALAQEEGIYAPAAIELLLLTGLRRSELTSLRWPSVDLAAAILRLTDTKAGRPHTVPLSSRAVAILSELPRAIHTDHVFPGAVHGRPLDVKTVWGRVRRRARLEDVRLHDLRRSVGSLMAMHGASLPLIGAVLNHTNPSTTAVYARIADVARAAALEDHSARLDVVRRKSASGGSV